MNENHTAESIGKIERQHMSSIVYEMTTKFDKKVVKVQQKLEESAKKRFREDVQRIIEDFIQKIKEGKIDEEDGDDDHGIVSPDE